MNLVGVSGAPVQTGRSISARPWSTLAALLIIVVAGVFYLATLREGQPWGDDFALYIRHAQNLVEGRGYANTGYIYNPHCATLSPRTYPPVYPILLVPTYVAFGLNLTAMKVETILFFVAFLLVCWNGFRLYLPQPFLLLLVALISFQPFFWDFKEKIVSDIPFLLFAYIGLFAIDRIQRTDWPRGKSIAQAALLGILMYLAYGTRSVGLVLVPSFFLSDLIRFRRIRLPVVAAVLVFALCMVLQNYWWHSEGSYLEQLLADPLIVVRNARKYAEVFFDVWDNGLPKLWRVATLIILSGLAGIGYLSKAKEKLSILDIFPLLYLAAVLVWPAYQGGRFLMPLLPIYLFFAVAGLNSMQTRISARARIGAFVGFKLLFVVSYVSSFAHMNYGPIRGGIGNSETQDCFEYIRSATMKDDIFIFDKPRALALFTNRQASVAHRPTNPDELLKYFRNIHARYLIVGPADQLDFAESRKYFLIFLAKYSGMFEEVYVNEDFKIFRIRNETVNGTL